MQEQFAGERLAQSAPARRRRKASICLTSGLIGKFLKELERTGHSVKTIESYRQNLQSYYDFLGADKHLTAQSLPNWRETLRERGYTQNSINSYISAVNSLYNFLGERNWQLAIGKRAAKPESVPELTREEYFRLLQEAKSQENIQLYLLIKLMATTDLTPSDMVLLTREAVDSGVVTGKKRGTDGPVLLPAALREELLDYARLWGLRSGPILLKEDGKSYGRTAITRMVAQLAEDIGIEPGKANPRNLRRMHLNTLAALRKKADLWVSEQYAVLLAEEESQVGWRT